MVCMLSPRFVRGDINTLQLLRLRPTRRSDSSKPVYRLVTNNRMLPSSWTALQSDGLCERAGRVGRFRRHAFMRQMPEGADRRRPPEQVALRLVATFLLQELQLGIGLDAFGQHRQAQAAAEAEHGADDGGGLIVAIDRLDERAVDLDLVERERAQVRERGIAG